MHIPQALESDKEGPSSSNKPDLVYERTQELCGLLVGYAFALQYVPSPVPYHKDLQKGITYMEHAPYHNHPYLTSFHLLTSPHSAVPRPECDSPNPTHPPPHRTT